MGYSYVVIRRGLRPEVPATKLGRIGLIGKRELEKQKEKQSMAVLQLHEDYKATQAATEAVEEAQEHEEVISEEPAASEYLEEKVESSLRQEAYHWPRLVFPSLKRSGHIILDACTPEGNVATSLAMYVRELINLSLTKVKFSA